MPTFPIMDKAMNYSHNHLEETQSEFSRQESDDHAAGIGLVPGSHGH